MEQALAEDSPMRCSYSVSLESIPNAAGEGKNIMNITVGRSSGIRSLPRNSLVVMACRENTVKSTSDIVTHDSYEAALKPRRATK